MRTVRPRKRVRDGRRGTPSCSADSRGPSPGTSAPGAPSRLHLVPAPVHPQRGLLGLPGPPKASPCPGCECGVLPSLLR